MEFPTDIGFSTHALERTLERALEIAAPYKVEQLAQAERWLRHSITWHPLQERWVLDGFDLFLVVEGTTVVTVKPDPTKYHDYDSMEPYNGKRERG